MSDPSPLGGDHPANQVILDGALVEPVQQRTTPAGRIVSSLMLEHDAEWDDLPPLRRLTVRIGVVAMDHLAETCRQLTVGQNLRVTGRLNQQRFLRSGSLRWGRQELVAKTIEVLPPGAASEQSDHNTAQAMVNKENIDG